MLALSRMVRDFANRILRNEKCPAYGSAGH
jgi:hypothetical protein